MQLTDEQLMACVCTGDSEALEILYDRHAAAAKRLIMRIVQNQGEAEDLVQEAFCRIWQQANHFNPQRGTFCAWLFTISRNLALDEKRRRRVRPQTVRNEFEVAQTERSPDSSVDVPEEAWLAIRCRQLRLAMKKLPPEQYQVLVLAYFQGKTRREIARITDTPLGTIHTRARLALQALRNLLGGWQENET